MQLSDLKDLIRHGENERVEFKSSTGQRGEAAKTICVKLNGISQSMKPSQTNTLGECAF